QHAVVLARSHGLHHRPPPARVLAKAQDGGDTVVVARERGEQVERFTLQCARHHLAALYETQRGHARSVIPIGMLPGFPLCGLPTRRLCAASWWTSGATNIANVHTT